MAGRGSGKVRNGALRGDQEAATIRNRTGSESRNPVKYLAEQERPRSKDGDSSSNNDNESHEEESEDDEDEGSDDQSEGEADDDEEEEADDILLRSSLDLSGKPLPPLKQLSSTLAKFKNLSQLNISAMQPSKAAGNPNGLTNLRWLGRAVQLAASEGGGFGSRLTTLNISENEQFGCKDAEDESTRWDGLQRLAKLMALNASTCRLHHFPPPSILLSLTSLKVLVLTNNGMTTLPTLPHLPQLNTLILSKNRLRALPTSLAASVPALQKLAVSHNALGAGERGGAAALPDLSACAHLRQVRLHCNPALRRLPRHLATWGRGVGSDARGTGIEILDLSECGLDTWDSIDEALLNSSSKRIEAENVSEEQPRRRVRDLTNLSLKGNGLAELSDYRSRLVERYPTLRILDNAHVIERNQRKQRTNTRGEATPRKEARRTGRPNGNGRMESEDDGVEEDEDDESEERAGRSRKYKPNSQPSTSAPKLPREKKRESASAAAASRRRADAEQQVQETEAIQEKKKTRRGARGSKKKQDADIEGKDSEKSTKTKQSEEDTVEMKRLQARAGPPPSSSTNDVRPPSSSAKDSTSMTKRDASSDKARVKTVKQNPAGPKEQLSGKEKLEAMKRKAWDAIDDGLGAASSTAPTESNKESSEKVAEDGKGVAKRRIEPSAVAGIVHVKKKRKQQHEEPEKRKKPEVKSAPSDPFAQVGMGLGGAWD